MTPQRRGTALRILLVLGAMLAMKGAIDLLRSAALGRPGWLALMAIAGFLFCVAARSPVGLPYSVKRPLLLGALPALLILNSMLAYEGLHVMPARVHFGPLFGWTLYAEAMMALAVLVGVALASGFTERSPVS